MPGLDDNLRQVFLLKKIVNSNNLIILCMIFSQCLIEYIGILKKYF